MPNINTTKKKMKMSNCEKLGTDLEGGVATPFLTSQVRR